MKEAAVRALSAITLIDAIRKADFGSVLLHLSILSTKHPLATHSAAIAGCPAILKSLFQFNAGDADARNEDRQTPAMLAAATGKLETLRLLFDEFHADPLARDDSGSSVFEYAAAKSQPWVLLYLFSRFGSDSCGDALAWAADAASPSCVSVILSQGVDPNRKNASGRTPLHCLAQSNASLGDRDHIAVANLLLSSGADPSIEDESGSTAEMIASPKLAYHLRQQPHTSPLDDRSLFTTRLMRTRSPGVHVPWLALCVLSILIVGGFVASALPAWATLLIWVFVYFLLIVVLPSHIGMPSFIFGMSFGMIVPCIMAEHPPGLSSGSVWMIQSLLLLQILILCIAWIVVHVRGPSHCDLPLAFGEMKELACNGFDLYRFCKHCHIHRPIRSRHCGRCGVCVARMDHHCVWTACCIGVGNHLPFLLFVLLLAVAGWSLSVWFSICAISNAWITCGTIWEVVVLCFSPPNAWASWAVVQALPFAVFATLLFRRQVGQISHNLLTSEAVKQKKTGMRRNQFDRLSVKGNWKEWLAVCLGRVDDPEWVDPWGGEVGWEVKRWEWEKEKIGKLVYGSEHVGVGEHVKMVA